MSDDDKKKVLSVFAIIFAVMTVMTFSFIYRFKAIERDIESVDHTQAYYDKLLEAQAALMPPRPPTCLGCSHCQPAPPPVEHIAVHSFGDNVAFIGGLNRGHLGVVKEHDPRTGLYTVMAYRLDVVRVSLVPELDFWLVEDVKLEDIATLETLSDCEDPGYKMQNYVVDGSPDDFTTATQDCMEACR